MNDFGDTQNLDMTEVRKRGSSRKSLIIDKKKFTQSAMVEPLAIEDLILSSEKGNSHFQRLRYFGCPILSRTGELDPSKKIDMERDNFVRSMYRLFKLGFNTTSKGCFDHLTIYIRWMDEKQHKPIDGDYFHNQLTDAYMTYWGELVTNGAKRATWVHAKQMLSFILKRLNRSSDARKLPSIKGVKKEAKKTQGLDIETELKPLVKGYFRAFKAFENYIKKGIALSIHPLWDEALFNKQSQLHGWTKQTKSYKKGCFIKAINHEVGAGNKFLWVNQLSRLAAMITFMFTGQNTTPILKLRHSDIILESHQAGKYYFNMEKARANYLSIDTSIGFSTHAKRFIETWLELSAEIQKDSGTDWLFPCVMMDETMCSFIETGRANPQEKINKLSAILGLAHATPSILRQTKIDTLMKVTEDIYLVSMSANNSISTLQVNYSHGLAKDHERNLSASNEAMYEIAKGANIEDAVSEAKYRFHDVLSEYDYQRLRKGKDIKHESQTPLGVRCQNNTKGAARNIMKTLEKDGIKVREEEALCTDFLACFNCSHHKLVAAVEDIWLMLSFRDTLTEMEQYPTVNSLPKERYFDLCNTIDYILSRFKNVSNENYSQAIEKQKAASHPLYASIHSLNDLLEVFS